VRRADIKEMLGLAPGLAQARAERRHLGSLPLIVLTADRHTGPSSSDPATHGLLQEIWTDLQTDLAGLSDRSTRLTADRSGHFIHLDQPDLLTKIVLDLCREITDPT
jgi:pimeloyl-ACP methyl ester carboxylesterase